MNPLRHFLRRPASERVAIVEASLVLALTRSALLLLPFRRLARWLGEEGDAAHDATRPPPPGARVVLRALEAAARHVPWDSRCLAQSLAASLMLRRRRLPAVTCLGVARQGDGRLRAHAWTRCGSLLVSGGGDVERYQVIATYVTKAAPRP